MFVTVCHLVMWALYTHIQYSCAWLCKARRDKYLIKFCFNSVSLTSACVPNCVRFWRTFKSNFKFKFYNFSISFTNPQTNPSTTFTLKQLIDTCAAREQYSYALTQLCISFSLACPRKQLCHSYRNMPLSIITNTPSNNYVTAIKYTLRILLVAFSNNWVQARRYSN